MVLACLQLSGVMGESSLCHKSNRWGYLTCDNLLWQERRGKPSAKVCIPAWCAFCSFFPPSVSSAHIKEQRKFRQKYRQRWLWKNPHCWSIKVVQSPSWLSLLGQSQDNACDKVVVNEEEASFATPHLKEDKQIVQRHLKQWYGAQRKMLICFTVVMQEDLHHCHVCMINMKIQPV